MGNYPVVVIDFETTGLSPQHGDRVIEVGCVLVSGRQIIDRFQSLMNPEMRISPFIEEYTGITNKMLSSAPVVKQVMHTLKEFLADHPLVAHNASFDARFLDAELSRINHPRRNQFGCSLLLSRRIYPDAPDHRLATLVRYKGLETDGIHHRALADAEMTAHLWMKMISELKKNYGLTDVPFELMQSLMRIPKKKVHEFMTRQAER